MVEVTIVCEIESTARMVPNQGFRRTELPRTGEGVSWLVGSATRALVRSNMLSTVYKGSFKELGGGGDTKEKRTQCTLVARGLAGARETACKSQRQSYVTVMIRVSYGSDRDSPGDSGFSSGGSLHL